jgi:hypothetical protein
MEPEPENYYWMHCKKCNVLTSHYRVTSQHVTRMIGGSDTLICSLCGTHNERIKTPNKPSDQDARTKLEKRGQQRLIDD